MLTISYFDDWLIVSVNPQAKMWKKLFVPGWASGSHFFYTARRHWGHLVAVEGLFLDQSSLNIMWSIKYLLVCRCRTGLPLFSRPDRKQKVFCVLDGWLDKRRNFKKPLNRLTDIQHHLSVIKITVHYSPDCKSNANESGSVLLPLLWEAVFFFWFFF